MLGQVCDWLQVEEVNYQAVETFMDKKIDDESIAAYPVYEAMTENAPGLFRCARKDAFVLVPPPAISAGDTLMLNFVFRPTIMSSIPPVAARKVA